ncbi:MAG: penicillin-binding protein 2 [Rikenellaceae bacterium]|nr:penicillin-binding protein 2 [Rikenellaceae bacterium]
MNSRALVLKIFVILVAVIILARLFHLQILDDRYKIFANNNVLRHEVQYPPRGEVYDRNGEFLIQSRETYDLMVVPRDTKGLDTALLCQVLGIDMEIFHREYKKAENYSQRRPSVLFKQLPKETKLKFDEFNFPGFYTQYRTVRSYPRKIAGNLLGYVGEVNQKNIEADPYYRSGDYIGVSGIESAYEKYLRGEKGVKIQLVDVHGIPKGSYADGMYDSLAVPGASIVCTIDSRLQALAEELLEGKVGSVVAIEPATGEILVMASSPTYDPDKLVGRQLGNNYAELLRDPYRPLINRAVQSWYPPGSTFKLVNALISLQEGTNSASDSYPCNHGYPYGRGVKCHGHHSPVNLTAALQTSCNAYFCYTFRNLVDNSKYGSVKDGFDVWYDYVESFGFGRKLDSDFRSEINGTLPTRERYDRIYRGSWSSMTILSLAIGQGEIGATPLQVANLVATVANRGYYYIPHVVKSIEGRDSIDNRFYERHYSKVEKKHFDVVANAMWKAVNEWGTATGAFVKGWDVCGKTGTAQNPQGNDHSTFACFAPLDDPKIAISVYIENGGFGATIAVPLAKLLLEQYLTGEVQSQDVYDRVRGININYSKAYGQ